jgi:hypothetical protein
LAEERRGPDPAADRRQELDAEIEDLTQRIADVVNRAGDESRQDLREYAIELLREETERGEVPSAGAELSGGQRFNPIAFALLLVLPAIPLLLSIVFAPIGLALLGAAALMAGWGLLTMLFRRT